MDSDRPRAPISKALAAGAIAVGLAAGSYGVASAASGSGSGSSSSSASPAAGGSLVLPATSAPSGTQPQSPWGKQRSDESLLTGDTATKVTQLAKAKVPNATIVRVETDADGHAAYEAHMVKADGTPVTVYVDRSFAVVSVETR